MIRTRRAALPQSGHRFSERSCSTKKPERDKIALQRVPGWTQMSPSSTGRDRLDHDDPVVAGLAAPELARSAVELAHIGIGLVAGENVEPLGRGIEADDGIG